MKIHDEVVVEATEGRRRVFARCDHVLGVQTDDRRVELGESIGENPPLVGESLWVSRFAGSKTMPIVPASSSSSRMRRAAATALRMTLPLSGSTPSFTPAAWAAGMRTSSVSRRSDHAEADVLSGCAFHMLSGSRVPVHRVTAAIPSRPACRMSATALSVSARRFATSGWMTL